MVLSIKETIEADQLLLILHSRPHFVGHFNAPLFRLIAASINRPLQNFLTYFWASKVCSAFSFSSPVHVTIESSIKTFCNTFLFYLSWSNIFENRHRLQHSGRGQTLYFNGHGFEFHGLLGFILYSFQLKKCRQPLVLISILLFLFVSLRLFFSFI